MDEAAAAIGFDFVVVDMEHGSFSMEGAVEMIRAVEAGGAAPVIRLPNGSPSGIQRALEAGAVAIVIPGVRTGEEVSQIVQAAKYAPAGRRGASPTVRGTMHGAIDDWKAYSEWSDRNTMVWVVVENTDAIKNLDAILSSGVDAVYVGPFDLSMSMGLKGDFTHPDVVSAQDHIAEVATSKGVDVGINLLGVSEPEDFLESARAWKKKGCRILSALSDRRCIIDSYRKIVSKLPEL